MKKHLTNRALGAIIQSEREKKTKQKGELKMNANEIKERIEKIERAIFYEEMADFMDWNAYYSLKNEKAELLRKLKEIEG